MRNSMRTVIVAVEGESMFHFFGTKHEHLGVENFCAEFSQIWYFLIIKIKNLNTYSTINYSIEAVHLYIMRINPLVPKMSFSSIDEQCFYFSFSYLYSEFQPIIHSIYSLVSKPVYYFWFRYAN